MEKLLKDYIENRIEKSNKEKIQTPEICDFKFYNPFEQKIIETTLSIIMGNNNTGVYHIYKRHDSEGVRKAITKIPELFNNKVIKDTLIEKRLDKIATDRVLVYRDNYLYIIGIPDLYSDKAASGKELYYLHDVYLFTQKDYNKLKGQQQSLLAEFILEHKKSAL